jgi:hypothetical protein
MVNSWNNRIRIFDESNVVRPATFSIYSLAEKLCCFYIPDFTVITLPNIDIKVTTGFPFCSNQLNATGHIEIYVTKTCTNMSDPFKFIYQFCHEFMHAIIQYGTLTAGVHPARTSSFAHENHWFEESFAEMSSQFAIASGAQTFINAAEEPFSWNNDGTNAWTLLANYDSESRTAAVNVLHDTNLKSWLQCNIGKLCLDLSGSKFRYDNCVVSMKLLNIFQDFKNKAANDGNLNPCVALLHLRDVNDPPPNISFSDHLRAWKTRVHANNPLLDPFVDEIIGLFF